MSKGRSPKKAKASKSPPPGEPIPDPGKCVAWIWWSAHPGAERHPPKDHFDKKIPADIRKEFFKLMGWYRDEPEKLRAGVHFKHLTDGVWELIVTRHNNPYRLLYFRWGNRAVALEVFFKNQQKTPTEVAVKRKAEWLRTRGHTPPE